MNIWIPKTKIIPVALPNLRNSFSGHIRMEAFQGTEFPRGSGRIYEHSGTRRVAGDFNNLILNQGLDYYGDHPATIGNQAEYCHVGTSSQAESVTDTALIAWTAYSGIDGDYAFYYAQGSPPYFGTRRYKYRFVAGFAGGNVNLNEVGFGAGNTVGDQKLTSRSLTKDGAGSPTTIPVLSTEYLDVFYLRRNYPAHINDDGSLNDGSGTMDIDGTSYGYTIRPAFVTDNDWGEFVFNRVAGSTDHAAGPFVVYGPNATLGAVTAGPSAVYNAGGVGHSLGTYTPGSYTRDIVYEAGLDDCVVAGDRFNAVVVRSSLGIYQILLDADVVKDNTKTFEWTHNWSWTRKAL